MCVVWLALAIGAATLADRVPLASSSADVLIVARDAGELLGNSERLLGSCGLDAESRPRSFPGLDPADGWSQAATRPHIHMTWATGVDPVLGGPSEVR